MRSTPCCPEPLFPRTLSAFSLLFIFASVQSSAEEAHAPREYHFGFGGGGSYAFRPDSGLWAYGEGEEVHVSFIFDAVVAGPDSRIINYANLKLAIDPLVLLVGMGKPYPLEKEAALGAGHLFRYRKGWFYLPVSLGATAFAGEYRGSNMLREDTGCTFLECNEYFPAKFRAGAGVALGVTPAVILGEGFFGLKLYLAATSYDYRLAFLFTWGRRLS